MCFQMFALFVKEKHPISETRDVLQKDIIFLSLKLPSQIAQYLILFYFVVQLLFRKLRKPPKTKCTRLKPSTVAIFKKLQEAKMTNRF